MPLANRDFLTVAEHRVLAQVADGRTNEEIAARLSVSPNTVHTHVAHILHKLDVPTRREAGRIFRALETIDDETGAVLARSDASSTDAAPEIPGLLDRLGVPSLADARRLYRSVITRGG